MGLIVPNFPMSGSSGGTTYGRNRFGYYIRNRTKPVNPNTSKQSTARMNFSTASSRWRDVLNQTQRDGWNAYASGTPVTNKLGQTIYLTGHQWYVAYYSFARQVTAARGAVVNNAPSFPGEAQGLIWNSSTFVLHDVDSTTPNTLTVVVGAADPNRIFGFQSAEDNTILAIQVSGPKGPGVSYISGPYTTVGLLEGDSGTPPTSPWTITLPFTVPVGSKLGIKMRAVDLNLLLTPYAFPRVDAQTIV